MRRLKIVFFHQGIACNGMSPYLKPLGGTESAMIFMARALAAQGHQVSVFTEVDRAGTYERVQYHHWREFEDFGLEMELDVFISVRALLPIMVRRWARVQIYFSPDAYDQPFVNRAMTLQFHAEGQDYEVGLFPLGMAKKYVDAIFCVGAWQAKTFEERFHICGEDIFVVHNGVVLSDFDAGQSFRQRKVQLAYCSTPFRGLEHLLRYFPEIKAKVPDAECAIMSGMQLYGYSDSADQEQYQEIYRLAQQDGVTLHGPLPKRDMAHILASSRVLAYPNTFAETFCIAALEAQAAGLPIVSTDIAAMKERVTTGKNGYLLAGHPNEMDYREGFIDRTISLLTNEDLWTEQSKSARQTAESYDYTCLAQEWEGYFNELLMRDIGPLARHPFIPRSEELNVLINGYPKTMNLSQAMLMRHYSKVIAYTGFPRCAERLVRDAFPADGVSKLDGPIAY